MRRANIGCGSIQPEGWDNYDKGLHDSRGEACLGWDVKEQLVNYERFRYSDDPAIETLEAAGTADDPVVDYYDYAVCSFMLQELNHHEIPGALENMMAILKPGGTLRILVPDIVRAFSAHQGGDEGWFPQDERTGDIDAKFCTYITWFGTVRSVFIAGYLLDLTLPFGSLRWPSVGKTLSPYEGIVELDSRPNEALIVEVTKR